MQDIWEYLKQSQKPTVIYGMGDGCDKIIKVCQEKGISVAGIFASDDHLCHKTIHGFHVTSFREAKEHFGKMNILLAFGVFRPDLTEKIKKMAETENFFVPEVPLFGEGLFDKAYAKEHEKELVSVYEMLSDNASRKVFENLIAYKITGRPQYLWECESEKSEDYKTLIPYKAGDIYVDLGAYDGDSVVEWHTLYPDHGEIYALEPNHKSFLKLKENTKDIPSVTALEFAAWNKKEVLFFNGKSGRSAAISDTGKTEVMGIDVDSVCQKADFIKFDVEGAEREAIEGCRRLITAKKPALCISAYHRTEDIFAIPLQVKALCPDYRVYLRHSPYVPAWDTQFYFVAD